MNPCFLLVPTLSLVPCKVLERKWRVGLIRSLSSWSFDVKVSVWLSDILSLLAKSVWILDYHHVRSVMCVLSWRKSRTYLFSHLSFTHSSEEAFQENRSQGPLACLRAGPGDPQSPHLWEAPKVIDTDLVHHCLHVPDYSYTRPLINSY